MDEIARWPGSAYPLGATWDGTGTNFALFSEHAQRVELLLFESPDDTTPSKVIPFSEQTAFVRHMYSPDICPGDLYAYRVHGPWDPSKGHRFNSNKALIDPYAKAIAGEVKWDDALFGYTPGAEKKDLSFDKHDSASFIPKCIVLDTGFDWENDRLLRTPWHETIIYETHVKGISMQHPEVPPEIRGTYAGLAHPAIIDHLRGLGITAVELLPVHQHVNDRILVDKGLSNYWGYNTIGYFAPDYRYAGGFMGQQVQEFKQMVKALHKAGIEIILDVVYNHTAEGNHMGPTLSFRGIDNVSYYHLSAENPRYYMDFTGTGNSMRMNCPHVTQLIMDSLRYWIEEMHVDGFRFDLAATLAREFYEVDRLSAFFDIIQQDPIISQVKLIAEPWDLGPGGYLVGSFPPLWTEWNGKYRDTLRSFWLKDNQPVAELGYRLTGSSDLYQEDGRKPHASINFITCHDGFTLNDLVSYDRKHNEANGENNRDGSDDNQSCNCGEEGPTDNPEINTLREKQKKNLLSSLFLSQGVPMLLGGDEMGRTQKGNNNSYCQDNDISWFDWQLCDQNRELLAFTRSLIQLRKKHPVFRRRKFFQGKKLQDRKNKDITWFNSDGAQMEEQDWEEGTEACLGIMLDGNSIDEVSEKGEKIYDRSFLLLLNACNEDTGFILPKAYSFELIFDTGAVPLEKREGRKDDAFPLENHSLALFISSN